MQTLYEVILVLVPMVLCLTVHEYSHARSALWLGDDTARHLGRLTLNPAAHIDVFGTLLLPGLAIATGSSLFFGWAKPVPVNPVRFTRYFFGRRVTMRTGMMMTAAAGPMSNIVFGLACAVALKVFEVMHVTTEALTVLTWRLLLVNFVLAVFNLIPVPPLDGSKVLAAFLPRALAEKFDMLERNPFLSLIVLFGLLGTGILGKVIGPVIGLMLGGVIRALGLDLSGVL
jgi:Zn-dependent protease